ncbi:MAG: N-acetylmuramoyl-L-alanine amidase CwlD [Lachnospira sp.]|nr:N-acetylmuramoyl-L-alanine amidase CwlD [Lachnospira sp.]
MQKKAIEIVMSVLMLISIATNVVYVLPTAAKTENEAQSKAVIVIDAGHGGVDPGKIGVNNVLEKDINLKISLMLKENFEKEGYKVILTRTDDNGLYSKNASNKKNEDMKKRCEIVANAGAKLVISIHQNSFSDEKVNGAQVFYYSHSTEGKELANAIQNSLNTNIKRGNDRVHKSNDNYYLLLNTPCPTVIVECGFLSNWEEATLLNTSEYQKEIADAIAKGALEYLQKAE